MSDELQSAIARVSILKDITIDIEDSVALSIVLDAAKESAFIDKMGVMLRNNPGTKSASSHLNVSRNQLTGLYSSKFRSGNKWGYGRGQTYTDAVLDAVAQIEAPNAQ